MTNNTPTQASNADAAPELPVECPHCHEQLPITADFCRRCGKAIERPAPFEGELPDPATLAPAKPAAPAVEESKALPGTPSLAARLTSDPLADGNDVPVDAAPTDLFSRRLTPIVLLVSTVLGFVVSLAAGANRLRSPDEIGAVLGWTAAGTVIFAIAGLLGCFAARRVWRRSSAGLVGGMVAVLVLTVVRCAVGPSAPKQADAAATQPMHSTTLGRPSVPGVNWSRRGGRWRSIQDKAGRAVYDFVTDLPVTSGGPAPTEQRPVPASELPKLTILGNARGDRFELTARNDSDWDVEQVTIAVTVWERPQVSRTYYLAHTVHVLARSTAEIETAVPEAVPSGQTRIDFTVRGAAGHTP